MTQPTLDVLTIGNAIMDVLAHVPEAFITDHGLTKSNMHLIDGTQAAQLADELKDAVICSGGSAANTAAGLANFGSKVGFIGTVGDDQLGKDYMHDLNQIGVKAQLNTLKDTENPTAQSIILITPDGERTMNTHLGACRFLQPKNMDQQTIAAAKLTYVEGYLWQDKETKKAVLQAANYAHSAERPVALTLSDALCVNTHREEFKDLIQSKTIDMIFCNIDELKALYELEFAQCIRAMAQDCEFAIITMGAQGAMAIQNSEITTVAAHDVAKLDDLTGAGDLFAAGFLHGHIHGKDVRQALELGCMAAADVISHTGARPTQNLAALARSKGLLSA